MIEPVLVIMAAGMGSRYGGLKQMDPIDEQGHLIIDYSIYDAIKAGFKKVVFVIKYETRDYFKEMIGNRIAEKINVDYVYQELSDLPEGYSVPEGRIKPWGTSHATLVCRKQIDGPFAVINADDYYGYDAFSKIYNFLMNTKDDDKLNFAMIGYILKNTLTENGYVARGICELTNDGYLKSIEEKTRIERHGEIVEFSENEGRTWNQISENTIVSMNMWGFSNKVFIELEKMFIEFLDNDMPKNPIKAEAFLPNAIGKLLIEDRARVKVLKSHDKWYGMTYLEDKEVVEKAIYELKSKGVYPEVF